jgi:conjugal transfer pilin signal peptidase TrbI
MATAASDGPGAASPMPRRRLLGVLGLLAGGALVLGALHDWRESHVILINSSQSLPNWAFLIHRGVMPIRGDYVFFAPPDGDLLRRHFGPERALFGKIVYGMPGDVVAHQGPIVTLNGKPVARMKPRTRFGEPLTPGATGPVPRGCYFAGTPHKDGFDSRYAEIGFVCSRQILGVGVPVL